MGLGECTTDLISPVCGLFCFGYRICDTRNPIRAGAAGACEASNKACLASSSKHRKGQESSRHRGLCAATMGMTCVTEMLEGMDPSIVSALAVVGGLVLARSVLCLLGAVFKTFLRPGKNLKEYGEWAVVTGATGKRGWASEGEGERERACSRLSFCLFICLPVVAGKSSGRDASHNVKSLASMYAQQQHYFFA